MATIGEANARINTRLTEANLTEGLDDSSQVHDHSALVSLVTIADMQCQIRENKAFVQSSGRS